MRDFCGCIPIRPGGYPLRQQAGINAQLRCREWESADLNIKIAMRAVRREARRQALKSLTSAEPPTDATASTIRLIDTHIMDSRNSVNATNHLGETW